MCARIKNVIEYAQSLTPNLSIFACSMGAFFSLTAFKDLQIQKCLFLSPIVDMERIIKNMMQWHQVSEERLEAEGEIQIPNKQPLYWDDYCTVKENPVVKWNAPTAILYGSGDVLCEPDVVKAFVNCFHCDLQIFEQGEHFFHTSPQLDFFRSWVKAKIEL